MEFLPLLQCCQSLTGTPEIFDDVSLFEHQGWWGGVVIVMPNVHNFRVSYRIQYTAIWCLVRLWCRDQLSTIPYG